MRSYACVRAKFCHMLRPRRGLSTRGTASLEFALVGTLLMTLLFGSVELGRFMISLHALRTTTADAARAVALQGAANLNAARAPCAGLNGPLSAYHGRAVVLGSAVTTVTMSGCVTLGSVTTVTVTVSLPFAIIIPVFSGMGPSLQEVAQAAFH